MARVIFPDKDDLVSDWLPVAIPNSKSNKDEQHLDVGEHVFCSMLGNGLESGIVLCSIYDDENKPSTGEQDIRKAEFEDGTEVIYDRGKNLLKINCVGDIEIRAQGNVTVSAGDNMKFTASRIDLN